MKHGSLSSKSFDTLLKSSFHEPVRIPLAETRTSLSSLIWILTYRDPINTTHTHSDTQHIHTNNNTINKTKKNCVNEKRSKQKSKLIESLKKKSPELLIALCSSATLRLWETLAITNVSSKKKKKKKKKKKTIQYTPSKSYKITI